MENLERLGNPKDCQDHVDFEEDVGNLIFGRCCWCNDTEIHQSLYVVK